MLHCQWINTNSPQEDPLNLRSWYTRITMSLLSHRSLWVSVMISVIFMTQNPNGRVQIWAPNIHQYLHRINGKIFFNYNGEIFPTFSIWPGHLFGNYSFIKVRTPFLENLRIIYVHAHNTHTRPMNFVMWGLCYHQTSHISRALRGSKLADHSDVIGASPVGAAPTTSSSSTYHLASMDWAKTNARRDEKHLSFGIWCGLY